MVTRVDKKPIIYNTAYIRVIKPSVVADSQRVLNAIRAKSVGYALPKSLSIDILEDYEDMDVALRTQGSLDGLEESYMAGFDDYGDEAIRIARMCVSNERDIRKKMRTAAFMEEVSGIQSKIFSKVSRVYYGTEAVYQLYTQCVMGNIFKKVEPPTYRQWAKDTAKKIALTQSAYMFMHPLAGRDLSDSIVDSIDLETWYAWDIYKKMETLALKLGSRKNLLAHAHYYGINRRGFTPDDNVDEDFRIPVTGYCNAVSDFTVHILMGIKYMTYGDAMFVLTTDDCINLATMAQCYYRIALYFCRANGYKPGTGTKALTLVKDIAAHCCRLIDSGRNFSHIIRSMHILAQGDFNDAYEETLGTDLGWRDRSANYIREARELDPMGSVFHSRAIGLASSAMDKLNTSFIYHAFVGDEMLLEDLRSKVVNMPKKVLDADAAEWSSFIRFSKTYLLCRYMMVNKRVPRVKGDTTSLNDTWASRCVSGSFSMPPQSEWGKVWIDGEFSYTCFADTWHLEAQDVSYVVKDSAGLIKGKYRDNRLISSELLMAMTSGNILDTLTESTPKKARERILRGEATNEVVLTTAPKAENAKPSWKKRVTFAADCEFRKMQAEFDRNCRKVMTFVRGPSLGVDQCVLEKQFADICIATGHGAMGGICSHDISAWSESMDRDRKFEFEQVLITMLDKPSMINIKDDWAKIKATVLKQGAHDVVNLPNGSFQGFDGSASTILHSMILIYCMDTARRKSIIPTEVKTNMATLIDDCIALMQGLTSQVAANNFWDHLKVTYRKLGFEVDDLKSIFSSIKAIYLSRRFVIGGEVPSDLKVFIKAHSSYEDPLRCSLDVPSDIFGAIRGAVDSNGNIWFSYLASCVSCLAELAHSVSEVTTLPASAAAIYALAPRVENGWGFPSMVDWCTNDVVDKRAHFNAILEKLAVHANSSSRFRAGVDVYPRSVGQAIMSIKRQPWRMVSNSSLFTNPFEALREGPLKPDMLKRNFIQDTLRNVATAKPWCNLLAWNVSSTTSRVRDHLLSSGPLHAPTLSALVNCMPDNYRLSLVGKAIGSQSLLDQLSKGEKTLLKRRVYRASSAYFKFTVAGYHACKEEYAAEDFACLTYIERSRIERNEFYTLNGANMTDHTFPDPIGSFTRSSVITDSMISPNGVGFRDWDPTDREQTKVSAKVANKGMYVPRRSNRVWEITSEYGKGWDSVSQRVAMGLAVLARAEADGHEVGGLLVYFIKSWNELSNITPRDTHLMSIHGSIKRLDSNPGSSSHPIICHRNFIKGFHNSLVTALNSVPVKCKELTGSTSHLHDFLAHETCMLATTCMMYEALVYLKADDNMLSYNIAIRPDCIVAESSDRMRTDSVMNRIEVEIMEGEDDYGLLQSCPELAIEIGIPTMKASWVRMINALMDGDHTAVEALRKGMHKGDLTDVLNTLALEEQVYTTSVVIAGEPAHRSHMTVGAHDKYAIAPAEENQRNKGDGYTVGVRTIPSKFSRALTQDQPEHVSFAVAIKSVVWSRLKDKGAAELAKIYYHDPDMDVHILDACAKKDFWRGIVAELVRCKRSHSLSESAMLGFKTLGVPGLHLKHANDAADVTQAIASYFGAHLADITNLVSDQICSYAGRRAGDYTKPILEKIVTNNPSVLNSKLRKEHMNKLITYNITTLSERIAKLKDKKPVHRGDKRFMDGNSNARLVELRCRKYVYSKFDVTDAGKAVLDEGALGELVRACAVRVCERVGFNAEGVPKAADTFSGVLKFMKTTEDYFDTENDRLAKADEEFHGVNTGWDAGSGCLGARYAYDTVISDSEHIAGTQFAVSASEIAPRLYKRIRTITPELDSGPVQTFDFDIPEPFDFDDESEDDDLLTMTQEQRDAAIAKARSWKGIEAWKALYTMIYTGKYTAEECNAALGTELSTDPRAEELREAHLDDFSDSDIYNKFPSLYSDYMLGGTPFDQEWLNRDEAAAYTTDELGRYGGGNLI